MAIEVALAQPEPRPSARLVAAPRTALPVPIDSNSPMVWDRVDGTLRLFALASWGGIPVLLAGPDLERLQRIDAVTIAPHPGDGIWMESVVVDDAGHWYAYYHHEVPAHACGRPDRSIPQIGAAKSVDRGLTWVNLGIILTAPRDAHACGSTNRYVFGGVGDPSAVVDHDRRDLFLFFSGYSKDPATQGVSVARLAWADRDEPVGRVAVWQSGAWLPARRVAASADSETVVDHAPGTPLAPVSRPWHDGNPSADAFWGPSVHWNAYLERYVMLLNRARDENFNNEGIYVSFARALDDPAGWSAPQKIMNGGGWYPQVAGLEPGTGTDRNAGQRARFLLTGRSEHYIEFQR